MRVTLNNSDKDIKFTIEYSPTEISFLDVLVKKRDTNKHTDVYYKPTDSKQYLMFNSCHRKHIKTSIPYSLARSFRMIVSDEEILTRRLSKLN